MALICATVWVAIPVSRLPGKERKRVEWVGGSDNIYFWLSPWRRMSWFMKQNPVHVISAKAFSRMGAQAVVDAVCEHFKDKSTYT